MLAYLVSTKIAVRRFRQKNYPQFKTNYGDFRFDQEWRSLSVRGVQNESGIIFGQVVRMLGEMGQETTPLLLPGEGKNGKSVYARLLKIDESMITTAGLHADADKQWNFEERPPEMGQFRSIVSHAILEHLIDPYGHVTDLCNLLEEGGSLIAYTVTPGFPYHRHPVDCVRFFPDWFEEVANRRALKVWDKYIGDEHIVYWFKKKI